MKLNPIASNMTEIEFPNGATVLFSYKTPVAAQLPDGFFVRTDKRWSVTTSRHIKKWLNGARATEVPQSDLDGMTDSGRA